MAVRYFSFLSNVGVSFFGLQEFITSRLPILGRSQQENRVSVYERVIGASDVHHSREIQEVYNQFPLIHGLCFLGSGLFGLVEGLHYMHWIEAEKFLPVANRLSVGLFLVANLYALEQNIRLFYHARHLSEEAKVAIQADRIEISAVLGIINTLGYVVTTVLTFFPAAMVPAIFLGLLSVSAGSIKILYDFFYLRNLPRLD